MFPNENFPITVELSSVAGTDVSSVLEEARELSADAFNLPDGILGRLTLDPIVLANRVKLATDKPVIAHLTCRDTTRLGLASRLLGASVLHVDGILALTGDAGKKNVFEIRAPELVALIAELNAGKFAEKNLKSPTHLKIGVAVNPNVAGQIEYLKKKIDAGAEFVQTQPIFDLAVAEKFLTDVKKAGIKIPILLGIMPLRSVKLAEYFNQHVTGITIPETIVNRLREDPDAGAEICLELLREIKSELAGVHLMPLGQISASNRIYDALQRS